MSEDNLQPPRNDSRSSSPGSGDPKPRVISGSLKDRIAKFSNPAAAPLVPQNPFGHAGGRSASGSSGGMIGNRLPALDPKSAGFVSGQQRKAREDRGMVGNRIPSLGRDPGMVPAPKSSTSAGSDAARPGSPASVDSSSASGHPESSNSPLTSRSSSPPTSTGEEDILPPALLSATLPDSGGPGTMTPSSTRADAGEDTSERSAPPTPMQGPVDPTIRGGHYDLIAPNLKLAAANQNPEASLNMDRTTSVNSVGGLAAPSVAASLGSSRASQYDPSSQGSENPQKMMQDVSGISTPTGTPRAAFKDLEGSARGEGSVAGDDLGEATAKLEGLQIPEDVPDRDATPEPPRPATTTSASSDSDIAGPPLESDPNKDSDLDDLKEGKLATPKSPSGTHTVDQNPINNVAEAGIAQGLAEHPIMAGELRDQGGVAGQRMEDIERPDEVQAPDSKASDAPDSEEGYAGSSDLGVRTATSPAGSMSTNLASEDDNLRMPNIIHGKRAAGTRLDESGAGPMTSGDTDYLKEALNEDRKKQAERDATDSDNKSALQTEQDRDEGMSRREQLVRALDQNADPNADLQGDIEAEQKEKAKNITMGMTGGTPPDAEDPDGELDNEHQEDEGAKTPKSETKRTPQPEALEETPKPQQDGSSSEPRTNAPDADDVPGIEKSESDGKDSSKPMQVQVEPAPIAQPAEEDATPSQLDLLTDQSATPTPSSPADGTSTPAEPPSFPTPPSEDPDLVSPPGEPSVEPAEPSTTDNDNGNEDKNDSFEAATPIDSSMLKSFPDVPDEEKPRVQVHVSSPHNTPHKVAHMDDQENSQDHTVDQGMTAPVSTSSKPAETPLARIPGHSKSLSNPPEATQTSAELGSPMSEGARRDSLGVTGSPGDPAVNGSRGGKPLMKRNSLRKSLKSPLLDDEDPGDFEAGEGWAVIHEVPGRNREQ